MDTRFRCCVMFFMNLHEVNERYMPPPTEGSCFNSLIVVPAFFREISL